MDQQERTRLDELMARLAAGEEDVVFVLHEEFGRWLTAKMRGHLAAIHAPAPDADDLEGLVLDAWFELARCAPGWDPAGGALPWNWARPRLRQLAVRWVGQYADELDEALTRHPSAHAASDHDPSPVDDEDVLVVFDRLADEHEEVARLRSELTAVSSERDRRILLEVSVQDALGDPSPAHTVAELTGLEPDAVRKVCSRVRARLRAAGSDAALAVTERSLDSAA